MRLTVVGGFWSIGFATRWAAHGMQTFLQAHQVYQSNPTACLFWLKFPSETGRVLLCAAIGMLVALIANTREMAAVTMVALLQMVLFLAGTVVLVANGQAWLHWFVFMLPWNTLSSLALIVGGIVIRKCRTPANLDRSTT